MTSAFVSLINRRDYDSSPSSSSSPPSPASSQKKSYSEHTNEYITLLIKKWKFLNLQDTNLWITFRDDFEEWTEQSFKTATNDVLRSLRNFLCKHGVWISRQKRKTIAKSLQEVLEKDTETAWTEEKILDSLDEKFESSKITRLIETDFERNSRDYSWQASSRSESAKHHLDNYLDSHHLDNHLDLENHHFEIDHWENDHRKKDHFNNHQWDIYLASHQ